jgi:hypothetical protein
VAGQTGMLDQVDLAHSARPQQPHDPVPGERLTHPQRHGRMLAAAIDVARRFSVHGARTPPAGVDDVWNLVLACAICNRGAAGKFDRLAHGHFLDTLWQRNERLISSHHPLRESIITTTGRTPAARLDFLRSVQTRAADYARADWRPPR